MSYHRLSVAVLGLLLLAACGTPPRPPVRAIPTETLKVDPQLLKPAPSPVTPAVQSK